MLTDVKPSRYPVIRIGTAIALGILANACGGSGSTDKTKIDFLNCGRLVGQTLDVEVDFPKSDQVEIKGVATLGVNDEGKLYLDELGGNVGPVTVIGENSLAFRNFAWLSWSQQYTATLTNDGKTVDIIGGCVGN